VIELEWAMPILVTLQNANIAMSKAEKNKKRGGACVQLILSSYVYSHQ